MCKYMTNLDVNAADKNKTRPIPSKATASVTSEVALAKIEMGNKRLALEFVM